MAGSGMSSLVEGFSEGQSIRFIHTEASDASVADMLTRMMGSPVLLVPELAQAPGSTLANVYVFTNGVSGSGPFGFQADVFDNPPGTSGYRPLRALAQVTWRNVQSARLLKSAAEVRSVESNGEVTLARPRGAPPMEWRPHGKAMRKARKTGGVAEGLTIPKYRLADCRKEVIQRWTN